MSSDEIAVEFQILLRHELDQLEQRLLQAHRQLLETPDAAELNRPLPSERASVLHEPEQDQKPKLSPALKAQVSGLIGALPCEPPPSTFELVIPAEGAAKRSSGEGAIVCVGTQRSTLPDQEFVQQCSQSMGTQSLPIILQGESTLPGTLPSNASDQSDDDVPEIALRFTWRQTRTSSTAKSRCRFRQQLVKTLSQIEENKKTSMVSPIEGTGSDRSKASGQAAHSPTFIIHPFSKTWVSWELIGAVLLLYDLVFVPMQVFEIPPNIPFTLVQWLTMIYWSVTLILTFFLSFQGNNGETLVTEHRQIMIHYLKGWFALDLLLVSSDWISVVIESSMDTSDDSLRNARMARIIRLGRIFRTLRILRIMKIGEFFAVVQSMIDSEYSEMLLDVFCNVLAILYLGHLVACAWFGLAKYSGGNSWLQAKGLTTAIIGEQYLYAMGWSLSTLLGSSITTVFPQTTTEYACALLFLVSGTIAVALLFSSTTAALTRIHELRSGDRQATYIFKKYLKQNNISGSLEARVTRYVDIAKKVHSKRIASDKVVLLHLLSGPLRLELELELHSPHLVLHRFFHLYCRTSHGAMSELCLRALTSTFLGRYDTLFRTFTGCNHMYFLTDGVSIYRRARGAKNTRPTVKIDKGASFCESVIWCFWFHRGSMKALIECHILALDADAFGEVTESHHEVFCHASQYAKEYLEQAREELSQNGYLWDVKSETMYPDDTEVEQRVASHRDPGYLNMLCDAEEVAAELMDVQSDSDSEDERVLKESLKNANLSVYVRGLQRQRSSTRHLRDSSASASPAVFKSTSPAGFK